MGEDVRPDEAARALAQIRDNQERVINVAAIPAWYWWLVGGLMVVLAAAVESGRPVTIATGVIVFVLGILIGTGWVVRGALQVQPRNDLLGTRGVLMILGFVALVVGVTLAVAFSLDAAGVSRPATLANLLGAVLLIVGGPTLTRALRRIMLDNRAGASR
jgi:hypothetical protein